MRSSQNSRRTKEIAGRIQDILWCDEAEALLPELAAGSMRPKVEAGADFARTTGNEALITSAAALAEALAGGAGPRIHA